MVGHWPFDEGPGAASAKDVAGGNDGEFRSSLVAAEIEWTDGPPVQESAVEFSGSNSWIQTQFEGIGGNDARTVTFWVRTEDDQNTHGIVGWGNSQSMQKFHIRVNNNEANGEIDERRSITG